MDESLRQGPTPESLGVKDPTGLIALFLTQLHRVERSILETIEENAREGTSRWQAHEREHSLVIEKIQNVEKELHDHLRAESDEDRLEADRKLVRDARLTPLLRAVAWVRREWRWLLLFAGLLIPQAAELARAMGVSP